VKFLPIVAETNNYFEYFNKIWQLIKYSSLVVTYNAYFIICHGYKLAVVSTGAVGCTLLRWWT